MIIAIPRDVVEGLSRPARKGAPLLFPGGETRKGLLNHAAVYAAASRRSGREGVRPGRDRSMREGKTSSSHTLDLLSSNRACATSDANEPATMTKASMRRAGATPPKALASTSSREGPCPQRRVGVVHDSRALDLRVRAQSAISDASALLASMAPRSSWSTPMARARVACASWVVQGREATTRMRMAA